MRIRHGAYVMDLEPPAKAHGDRKMFVDMEPGESMFDYIVEWVEARLPEEHRDRVRHIEVEVKFVPEAERSELDPDKGMVKVGGGYRPFSARLVAVY